MRRFSKSPYWYACITLANGRQTQRSTKTTDKRKALAVAYEWEKVERDAKAGALTEAAARKHIAKSYEIAVGRSMHFHSAEEWFASWLKEKKRTARPGTVIRYEPASRAFVASLGERGKLDLRHVDVTDVEKFREELMATGKSNKSVNMDCKAVSVAFNKALRQGLVARNPFSTLEPLPEAPSVKKPFTQEQVEAILAEASEEWKGLCLVGFYSGMRLSDAAALRWGQVSLEEKIPVFRYVEKKKQEKHRREIVLPVHSRLLEHLLSVPRGGKDAPLFPNLAGKSSGGNKGLSQSFKRILLRAGIVKELYGKKKEGSAHRQVSPYGFHSFRHGFKSMLANKGVPADLRDVLTGHAKPSVAEAYVHREISTLAEAVENLEAVA